MKEGRPAYAKMVRVSGDRVVKVSMILTESWGKFDEALLGVTDDVVRRRGRVGSSALLLYALSLRV